MTLLIRSDKVQIHYKKIKHKYLNKNLMKKIISVIRTINYLHHIPMNILSLLYTQPYYYNDKTIIQYNSYI